MKLTIVGGGGFRVPQLFEAVAGAGPLAVDEVCLYDVDAGRVRVIARVLDELAAELSTGMAGAAGSGTAGAARRMPAVTVADDLPAALAGADFVFSAMRVGGTAGRVNDERIALQHGVLGQETVGAGGLAYALRTLPHARTLAAAVAEHAPQAWVVNFTNPAGVITQAMREVLGRRVVGICDTPVGLVRRAARAAGVSAVAADVDYVGLNHLGWLRRLVVDGRDVLPEVLASDDRLDGIEEARILGPAWVRALGALPNEYLFYYAYPREAVARMAAGQTRGEYLDDQQGDFYTRALAGNALDQWQTARHRREATYLSEARPAEEENDRRPQDVADGGYQEVALTLMTALVTGTPASLILDVGNADDGGALLVPGLSPEAVVEVPCTVDGDGVHPHRVPPVTGDMFGLMAQVKASEELLLRASAERSTELVWRAFAAHPLVDSVAVARRLVADYVAQQPELAAALG